MSASDNHDGTLTWGRTLLTVTPEHFTLADPINPWMAGTIDQRLAQQQWSAMLTALRTAGAEVSSRPGVPGMPDQVFTMNMGFVYGRQAVVSQFRYPARQVEQNSGRQWFLDNGYQVLSPVPEDLRFEAGDAFVINGTLVAAAGPRSDEGAWKLVGDALGLPTVTVRMSDTRFYHLDTCLSPISSTSALIYAAAFDVASQKALAELVPDPVLLTDEEALAFSANSVAVGRNIVGPAFTTGLEHQLRQRGFTPVPVDCGEFLKSGGAVRCLTLPLDLGA